MSYSGIGRTWAEDRGREWASEGKLGISRKIITWEKLPYDLKLAAKRLEGVNVILGKAMDVIPQYDSSESLFYLDPSYYPSTRVSPKAYEYEMTELDHLQLLRLVRDLKGKVIISGYDNFLYSKELIGWTKVEVDFVAFSSPRSGGKPKRTEILYVKP
jgi:DNA adenine methylase